MRYCSAKETREEASENRTTQEGKTPSLTAMTKRIPFTHEFLVQSDSGGVRVIVCAEDCAEMDGVESQTHDVPTALYRFQGGDLAAKIGDLFLDCSGEIYRRMT